MDTVLQTSVNPALIWQVRPAREFGSFAQAWQRLNDSVGASALLHPDFVASLLEHFGNDRVHLAVLGHPDDARAMALVEYTRAGEWQTFQPSQAPIGMWLQQRDLDTEALCRQLLPALPGLAVSLALTCQDPALFPRSAESPLLRTLDHFDTGHIQLDGSFSDYLEKRPKNVVRQIKRRLRRLEEANLVPLLESVCEPDAMAEAVEQFARLESAGWKQAAGTAVRSGGSQASFYTDLLQRFSRSGKARVYRYWLGDTIAAMNLCVVGERTLFFLKTAHLEELRKYSPGILMKYAIFEQCWREPGIERLEFTGRVYEWQKDWIHGARVLYHVTYYRSPWLPRVKALTSTLRSLACTTTIAPSGAACELVVRTYDSLGALPESYSQLFERVRVKGFFHSLPWFQALADHLTRQGGHVRVYGLEPTVGAGRPAAALLLTHVPSKRPALARRLSAASTYYSPEFAPHVDAAHLAPADCVKSLAIAAAQDASRWSVIDLSPLDPSDLAFGALRDGLRSCGFLTDSYFRFGNWYLNVAGRSYSEYFDSLPSAIRNTVRRKRRHIERNLGGRIEIVTDDSAFEKAIADYERVYAASWKTKEPYPEFIRELARICVRQGWLRLGIVYLGDIAISAQIWIVYEGVASIYKLAYDERYAHLSAGSVLTAALMEHVIDQDRVAIVDYLSGDDAYKKDWMSHRAERWGLIAFNPRTVHGLLAASRHFGGRALSKTLRG